jgi:peptidoglycan/LPS O-acetylase OafA/YrhL
MSVSLVAKPVALGSRRGSEDVQPAVRGAHADHYWPEIDGLRAVAILLVVLFHAGVPQLAGGFVGVDVFFVLSGFLITGLLGRELDRSGRIDLLDFYARRARRLLPALVVVLLSTLAVAAFLLTPVGEQQGLGISAIAACLFVANVLFHQIQLSYFAGQAEDFPLLHLWTLSVEEQFYIVWPLVMIGVAALVRARGGDRNALRRAIVLTLAAASLASFVACWWLTASMPSSTFYLMHFRAWEFGLGALLALLPVTASGLGERTRRGLGTALIVAGLAAVLAAALLFDRTTMFPGLAATLPVLGTAAAIAGIMLAPGTLPCQALASAPMVMIGKLSYSWYLWHWPLLALARPWSMGDSHLAVNLGLCAAALVLSALTWRFVEEPVRRLRPGPFAGSAGSVKTGLGLMGGVAAAAMLLTVQANWRLEREPLLTAAARASTEPPGQPAHCTVESARFTGLAPVADCALGAKAGPLVMMWGDSHAWHFMPAMVEWARQSGSRVLLRDFGGCKPYAASVPEGIPARNVPGAADCVRFNAAILDSLPRMKQEGARAVVLAARWSVASQLQNGLADWEGGLAMVVRRIRAEELEVVLVAETPHQPQNVPVCVARRGAEACARPRARVDAERAAALATLERISSTASGVSVLDPLGALCTGEICPAVRDGAVLYRDDNHIAPTTSRTLAPLFGRALGAPVGTLMGGG